ncbi:MAG: Trk system potassium transporter TrkA [Catonella sp.]|nr:Trk system potassium transporter TrkA [Catonella sp.]
MNIIIVGCGKVGYTLAKQLSEEDHDITVIDTDSEKLQNAVNVLDIQAVQGNGTSYKIQMEADVENADLLIAVTGKDEINLLCCLIAKKAGNCQTIARVRDPHYFAEINFIKEELGLSMAINSERTAAFEIARLIHFPSAIEVDTFNKGRINLISVTIPGGSVLNGMSLINFSQMFGGNVLVCIVRRGDEVMIPSGQFVLMEGDTISCILRLRDSYSFFHKVGINSSPIKNVIICGGGTIAYYLTQELIRARVSVKIIESDNDRCEQLSEMLPEALVIHGDATNKGVLLEEGIKQADAVVSITNIDEENLLLSLYTHHVSKAKPITKINKIDFEEVINELPVGSIVCPKEITSEYILKYVRSMQNSFGSNVETLYRLVGGRVEALEFIVKDESDVTNIPLSDLKLKHNILLASIARKGKIITPSGKDVILPGDSVVVVTTLKGLSGINDILEV